MTTVTFLVGLPGTGKSTWREVARPIGLVASSDDYIEGVAKYNEKTYNDVFKDAIGPAQEHFDRMVLRAVESNTDLIVDRTNLTVESRRKTLSKIPVEWKKHAIVFRPLLVSVWRERLVNRAGKTIPENVLERMNSDFRVPTLEEGFDRIIQYLT